MSETHFHKRGQTFDYLAQLSVADGIPTGDWLPRAQLRKAQNNSPSGLIANINASWLEPNSKFLKLRNAATQDWPLGPAELDVRFESSSGQIFYSTTIPFEIVRGVTQ